MTLPADIAAIAARHDIAYSDRRHSIVKAFKNAHNDRGALLRAYRELAGELEAVSKSWDAAHAEVERLTLELQVSTQQAGELRDERGRLRASHAKLRAVLDQALTQLIDNDTADTDDLISVGNAIRDALSDAQHPEQQPHQLSQSERDALNRALDKSVTVIDVGYEQQPDIDAFLGEGRKPVRSLASVMVPSARDPEQQPENDPHMLCVCGHAVVEHTCANDDCGCLAFKRAATAPSEQQPDSDARDGRDRIAYAPFGRCAKCGEAITSFHNTGHCKSAP